MGEKQAVHGCVVSWYSCLGKAWSVNAYIHPVWPECLSSHSFRIPSTGFFPDYQCTDQRIMAVAIMYTGPTVFYFDNISFLAHLLNQLFIPNESSVSQASYRTMVLTICSNCSRNKPFYGGRVVEKNEMHGDEPVSDMWHAFRAS